MKSSVIHLSMIASAVTALLASPAHAVDVDEQVKEIRAFFAMIEEADLRTGEMVKFEAKDEPVSGTCTRYLEGGKVVKVKLSYTMGDHGGSDEYFYYQDGKLVFAFATDSSWRFGGKQRADGQAGTIDTVAEHRAYFADGKLIRHLSKEASSEDAKKIPELLSKAENKPSEDKERAVLLQRFGNGAARVKTPADLDKLLTADE